MVYDKNGKVIKSSKSVISVPNEIQKDYFEIEGRIDRAWNSGKLPFCDYDYLKAELDKAVTKYKFFSGYDNLYHVLEGRNDFWDKLNSFESIKSDYDFWHMTPQQSKFNSEFNSWFSHFQMNDDKLPEYKEGNDWVNANKGKPWMEELCEEYNIYPTGPRECAAFYMALKSIGEINQWGQPINNSRQIKSSFNYYDGFEDDVAYFAEQYSDNDDIVELVAGDIENDHPTESPEEFDSLMRAVHEELKRQGYFKQPWQVNSSKKPIVSNKEPADMDMAYQLEGYIESDGQLYTQMIVPVIKNLERKVKRGIYDYNKSLILWQHVADEGAKRYVKEFGGPAYNVATRKEVAKKLSEYYEENYMGDNPIESSNKRDSIRKEQEEIMRKDMDYFKKHGKPRPHKNNPDYTYVSCDENGDVVESSKQIKSSWEEDVDFVVDEYMNEWMEKHPNSTTEEYTAARKKYHDWVYERV